MLAYPVIVRQHLSSSRIWRNGSVAERVSTARGICIFRSAGRCNMHTAKEVLFTEPCCGCPCFKGGWAAWGHDIPWTPGGSLLLPVRKTFFGTRCAARLFRNAPPTRSDTHARSYPQISANGMPAVLRAPPPRFTRSRPGIVPDGCKSGRPSSQRVATNSLCSGQRAFPE